MCPWKVSAQAGIFPGTFSISSPLAQVDGLFVAQEQSWGLFFLLPWWFSGKEPTCQCRRCGFHPWVGKIPWRRK